MALARGETPTTIDWQTCDGMFIKQIVLREAGTLVAQHSHVLDHSTLLARGSIIVWRDGACSRHRAPEIIFIPAGIAHEFQTLEPDCLLYCLHNLHGGNAPAILAEHQLELEDLDAS